MTLCFSCLSVASIFVQGCSAEKQISRVELESRDKQISKIKGISREEAISIANRDALKDYRSRQDFNVIAREQSIFWRIIYDGGGSEYVIDKVSGSIIRKQKVPQAPSENKSLEPETTISQQQAIEIARKDAYETYGNKMNLDEMVAYACEQAKVWRVIFDYKLSRTEKVQDLPHASFPKYVIDKRTGNILHREMN